MYLVKTPTFIQNLFPNFTWRISTQVKEVFFTFDDGPIPEVTPWVLDQLRPYNAKVTFFCVGDNIRKHPDIFSQIKAEGHSVGNHTFHHFNGWATENIPYFHDVRHGANYSGSVLFRPPYGRLKPKQTQFLQRHYRIVMWDVLSGDFDPNISSERCFKNVMQNVTPGSIVVFHDSLKAMDKLSYVLPKVLKELTDKGYSFSPLAQHFEESVTKNRKSA